MRASSAVSAVLLAATASAAPVTLTQSGFLLDANDAAVEATGLAMTFALHDQATGGSLVWTSAACPVDVRAGYYATTLGGDCNGTPALDSAHLPPGQERWLSIRLGAVTLDPRVRVGTLPAAQVAQNALALGNVAASSYARLDAAATHTADVTVTGTAQFAGKGTGLTELSAAAITVGTLADAQLASGSDLAKLSGAQTFTGVKTFSQQASFSAGLTSAGNIVAGTGAKFVGDGSLLTNLPSSGGGPNSAQTDAANTFSLLNTFSAGLRLGNVSTACSDSNAGTLRWTGAVLQVCVGTVGQWITIASQLGQTAAMPAASCAALLAAGQQQSGMYYIDPNGPPTSDALYTWCDMTTDQGGWTLVYSNLFDGNEGGPSPSQMSGTYGTPGLTNDFSANPQALFPQLGASKMLVREDGNWIRFNNLTSTSFNQFWNVSLDTSWSVTSMTGTTYTVSNGYHGHSSGVHQFGQSAVNSTVIFEYNAFTGTRDTNHYWHVWPNANGTYAAIEGVGGSRRGTVWLK